MIIEKNVFTELVLKYIESNCDINSSVNDLIKFKTYLKKDDNNCFIIIDKENSIKCLFKKEYIKQYFSIYPSTSNLDQYDGTLIMIKNAAFDVVLYKNINKTISYRVVLCIFEFELDIAQKMSIENYNAKYPNVNFVPKIEEQLRQFYHNTILNQVIHKDEFKDNTHLVNANVFITNKFFNNNENYCSVKKVLPKGCSLMLLHNDKSSFAFINDPKTYLIKIIELKDNEILKVNHEEEEDTINIENLSLFNVKKMLYKQNEIDNGNVDLKNEITETGTMLKHKRKRDLERENENNNSISLNDIPIPLQNLIQKMKNKLPITKTLFERYKKYKKLHEREYIKENI